MYGVPQAGAYELEEVPRRQGAGERACKDREPRLAGACRIQPMPLNSPLLVDGPEVIGNRITRSPTGNPTSLQVRCGHLFNLMHGKDKQYAGRFFIAVQEAMRDIAGASTA